MPKLSSVSIDIDLSGITMEDVKLFVQEGAGGTPEMAASCGCASCASQFCISCGAGSCNQNLVQD